MFNTSKLSKKNAKQLILFKKKDTLYINVWSVNINYMDTVFTATVSQTLRVFTFHPVVVLYDAIQERKDDRVHYT